MEYLIFQTRIHTNSTKKTPHSIKITFRVVREIHVQIKKL